MEIISSKKPTEGVAWLRGSWVSRLRTRLMMAIAIAYVLALVGCAGDGRIVETATGSLWDQSTVGDFSQPWRVLLHRIIRGTYRRDGDLQFLVENSQGLVKRGPFLFQDADSSCLRFAIAGQPFDRVLLSICYKEEWPKGTRQIVEAEGSVEAKLLRDQTVIVSASSTIHEGVAHLTLPVEETGPDTLEIWQRIKHGTRLPIKAIIAIGLPQGALPEDIRRARGLLYWAVNDPSASSQQALRMKRFPASFDGCTRDGIAATEGDTLVITVPSGSAQKRLRLWIAGLRIAESSPIGIQLLARNGRNWAQLDSIPLRGLVPYSWREVSFSLPADLRPTSIGLRLAGRGNTILIAEPLFTQTKKVQSHINNRPLRGRYWEPLEGDTLP